MTDGNEFLQRLRAGEVSGPDAAAFIEGVLKGTDEVVRDLKHQLDKIHIGVINTHSKLEHFRKQTAALEAENTRLRAALAQSELPCVYCALPKEEWEKCQHGFPGCSRADDAMGCPELGASLTRDKLQEALEKIAKGDVVRGGTTSEDGWEHPGSWAQIAIEALEQWGKK